MSKTDKREKLINELKVMVAVFENMCNERNISYRQIQSKEILDLKNGNESEEDILEVLKQIELDIKANNKPKKEQQHL